MYFFTFSLIQELLVISKTQPKLSELFWVEGVPRTVVPL